MKNLFVAFLLALIPALAVAQSCPAQNQETTVFFGNGINTDRESANDSLVALLHRLGRGGEGSRITYQLAYNQTSGIALDLLQAAAQAGIQFSSQISGYLYNLGLTPEWFDRWYRDAAMAASTIAAEDLPEHVSKYRRSIRAGKKVVVVAHSQGNFYVNAAKQLLAQELTAQEMQSFAVFGVAVPANNVAGASAPYYTNHRDVIQMVPGALPHNWALHHRSGVLADDIGPVQAHLFTDTYMSDDYDLAPALVLGIRGLISGMQQPVARCDDYRRYFLSRFSGTYAAMCVRDPATIAFTQDAAITPGGTTTMADPNVNVSIVRDFSTIARDARETTFIYAGRSAQENVQGKWGADQSFTSVLAAPHTFCSSHDAAPTFLNITQDIDVAASGLMRHYRAVGVPHSCLTFDLRRPNELPVSNETSLPISVDDTRLWIGEKLFDLGASSQLKHVEMVAAQNSSPADYEPQFAFRGHFPGDGKLFLLYKQFGGLTFFSYETPEQLFSCNFERR